MSMQEVFELLDVREHYIPVRVPVLVDTVLAGDCLESPDTHEHFRMLTKMFLCRFHFDYHDKLLGIQNDFAPFDPDADTITEVVLKGAERRQRGKDVLGGLRHLAEACNFKHLSKDDLNQILSLQPLGGLSVSVDTKQFDEFDVYYRGARPAEHVWPWWQFWRRNKRIETRRLQRVLVLARYRPSEGGNLVIKLFKEIRIENLKIIAPKVIFSMPFFDKLKVGGSFLGGLGTVLFKILNLVAFTGQLLIVVAFSVIVVIVKGIFGFINSRTKYLQIYSSSLYFQSLSNNNSAIASLVNMAEEQETKEAILAAYCLYLHRGNEQTRENMLTEEELDSWIENWLNEKFKLDIDFEVDDAIRKLSEKNLLLRKTFACPDGTEEERYSILDLPAMLEQLDYEWDNFFTYNKKSQ